MFTCAPVFFMAAVGGGGAGTTFDPSFKGADIVLSNGNLTAHATQGFAWEMVRTIASDNSGKRFIEYHLDAVDGGTGGIILGMGNSSAGINTQVGADANSWGWQATSGPAKYHNGNLGGYGSLCAVNDTVGMLFDFSTGNLVMYKNGTSQGNMFTGIAAGTYFPMISLLEPTCQVTIRSSSSSWVFPPGIGEVPWQ